MISLPAITRWTAERKKEIVALVASGFVTREAVCAHYAVSQDELTAWQREFRRCNNPEILNAVAAALSDREGRTPRQVVIRLDGVASSTVRHALAQLVADGRATFEGPDTRRLYKRTSRTLAETRRVHAQAMTGEEQ